MENATKGSMFSFRQMRESLRPLSNKIENEDNIKT